MRTNGSGTIHPPLIIIEYSRIHQLNMAPVCGIIDFYCKDGRYRKRLFISLAYNLPVT